MEGEILEKRNDLVDRMAENITMDYVVDGNSN
jgi:hypothetical protein